MSSRQEGLDLVTQAIMKDRNRDYAPPEQNFERIAQFWRTYLDGRSGDDITPYDTSVMMALVKVARMISSPHVVDHAVDLAGYALCCLDVLPSPDDAPPALDEDENAPVRCIYEGEPGQFNEPGADTWYADTGRKVTLTPEQWGQAIAAGALKYEEDQ